jgi:hypothetical protein
VARVEPVGVCGRSKPLAFAGLAFYLLMFPWAFLIGECQPRGTLVCYIRPLAARTTAPWALVRRRKGAGRSSRMGVGKEQTSSGHTPPRDGRTLPVARRPAWCRGCQTSGPRRHPGCCVPRSLRVGIAIHAKRWEGDGRSPTRAFNDHHLREGPRGNGPAGDSFHRTRRGKQSRVGCSTHQSSAAAASVMRLRSG